MSEHPHYVTADLNEKNVDHRVDVTAMEFDDASFDMVICCHVLEHVQEDRRALQELARVTSAGGIAILMAPVIDGYDETYEDDSIVDPGDRRVHFGQWDHVRRYGRDYYQRIADAGFAVEIWHASPNEEIRYGLQVGENVIVGRKLE